MISRKLIKILGINVPMLKECDTWSKIALKAEEYRRKRELKLIIDENNRLIRRSKKVAL